MKLSKKFLANNISGFIFLGLCVLFAHGGVQSQPLPSGEQPVYEVPAVSALVKVDGRLEEDLWREALVIELPYEIDPGENTPAMVRTEVLLSTGKSHLYLGVRAFDPEPGKIRAHYMDRDKAFDDDWVMVVLDPFLDQRRGFQFLVTPLGVQMDTLLTEVGHGGAEVDPTWDAIWESAGRIGGDGYVVEIAIPFTSLRFPRLRGAQKWGFQALRHYPRNFSYYFRATPWNRNRDCVLCEDLILSGFSGASPGKNLELNPTLTSLRTDERTPFPSGALKMGGMKPEFGFSTRWGITPNISLNAALNPDFSHVEADVAQLEINTRYALFYPEKRPFFLESADLFRSPLEVIYTRTLADPLWGLKVTGKEQRDAFGVLASADSLTNLVLPSSTGSELGTLEQRAFSTILRFRRDVGKRSSLGGLLTDRRGSDYQNTVCGLDGQLQLSPADRIVFQILGTRTAYPAEFSAQTSQPGGRFNGSAWSFFYGHEARDWHWWARTESLGRGFRADAGFIPRVDTRTAELGLRRVFWPKKANWYGRLYFDLEGFYAEDQAGKVTDKSLKFSSEIHGPLRSTLLFGLASHTELFNTFFYDQKFLDFTLSMQPRSNLSLLLSGKWGDAVDYVGSRPARIRRANPGILYFLNQHLQLQLDQLWERLEVEGGRLYLASLTQAHLIYQFNVRVFLRAILQYLDVQRNLTLSPADSDPLNPHLFTQFLFSYKINPQTLLFLGYSDNSFGWNGLKLKQKDRTFFLKISYAWVQ